MLVIPWKSLAIGLTLGKFLFESYLRFRQLRVLQRTEPPESLSHEIDTSIFVKTQEYSRVKLKFKFVCAAFDVVRDVLIAKFNVYMLVWRASAKVLSIIPFLPQSELVHSLVFAAVSHALFLLWKLPFEYYYTFVIEEQFGFNKSTVAKWLSNETLSTFVQSIVDLLVMSVFTKIIHYYGKIPVLTLSVTGGAIALFFVSVWPSLVAPLFWKVSPLPEGPLLSKIEKLAKEKHFRIDKVSVVDASSASTHSNAYAAGFPWGGSIGISDTLNDQMTDDEVVAVVAHELGHLKLHHWLKQAVILSGMAAVSFKLTSKIIEAKSLYEQFGFGDEVGRPLFIGYLLSQQVLVPLSVTTTYLQHYYVQKFEADADVYSAVDCGFVDASYSAVAKTVKENLSSVSQDWLYQLYYSTHPSSEQRLEAMKAVVKK